MSEMTTLSEVLDNLKKEGYTIDFNLADSCLICHQNSLQIHPEDFIVDRHYRFEGDTDPGDEAIVYAISSNKHNVKGTLVNGYGLYSDEMTSEMVKALHQKTENIPVHAPANNTTSKIISLDSEIEQLSTESDKDIRKLLLHKTKNINILLIALNPGAELKRHTAPGPISVQLIKGSIVFVTDEASHALSSGEMLILEKGIPHSVVSKTNSLFMVTISLPYS